MNVYLIRHGKTEHNQNKAYQGKTDSPLSNEGKAELRQAEEVHPDRVFVTKYRRTAETASILFPGVPQVVVPGLEEMDFGDFEGRSYLDMEHDPDYRAWVDSRCTLPIPNGESLDGFTARVCKALDALLDDCIANEKETVVIVAHGGTEMAVMSSYAVPKLDYFSSLTPNGCGYLLEVSPKTWHDNRELRFIKQVSYLKGETE